MSPPEIGLMVPRHEEAVLNIQTLISQYSHHGIACVFSADSLAWFRSAVDIPELIIGLDRLVGRGSRVAAGERLTQKWDVGYAESVEEVKSFDVFRDFSSRYPSIETVILDHTLPIGGLSGGAQTPPRRGASKPSHWE